MRTMKKILQRMRRIRKLAKLNAPQEIMDNEFVILLRMLVEFVEEGDVVERAVSALWKRHNKYIASNN